MSEGGDNRDDNGDDEEKVSAKAAADAAIKQVGDNADEAWWNFMMPLLVETAKTTPWFNSKRLNDKRIERRGPPTREPRAMGALMRWGAKRKYIQPTEEGWESGDRTNHNRPMRMWISNICEVRARRPRYKRRFDPRQGALALPEVGEEKSKKSKK